MTKKLCATVLGLAALILNPFFACSTGQRGGGAWTYGADELRAAVEGTWTITVPATRDGAPEVAYTVTLRQGEGPQRHSPSGAARGLVAPAAACDQRSLVRTASACIDSTEMPLEVQIVKGPSPGDAEGQLAVIGHRFDHGRLTLSIAGALLTAQLSPQGVASKVEVTVDGRDRDAEMVRTAPAAPAT